MALALHGCDIHLATGHGPWEDSGPTYRFSQVLLPGLFLLVSRYTFAARRHSHDR